MIASNVNDLPSGNSSQQDVSTWHFHNSKLKWYNINLSNSNTEISMHSSMIRTARFGGRYKMSVPRVVYDVTSYLVPCSFHCPYDVNSYLVPSSFGGGGGGLSPRGCLSPRVLPTRLSAESWGVHLPLMDKQTGVKTLPSCNFVSGR